LKINEVTCKNALVKSGIEGMDYALNPYTGCQHACLYCYAEFMKKYTHHPEPWGEFVDVKINVADRLRQQVKKTKPGTVMIGTVTDAYQPIERKYSLTRQCLEVLSETDFPVFIQSKSDLILRDIELLKKIKTVEVGLTITCPDSRVERMFEPGAADLERRFETLSRLKDEGLSTFVFFGPILPFFSDTEKPLMLLLSRLQKIGIEKIYFDKMNYLKSKLNKFRPLLAKEFPQALRFYEGIIKDETGYADWLKATVMSALNGFSFKAEILF
jgi:DNA repair photolyase